MVRKIFVILVKLATKIGFKLKIENIEKLPKEGAYIICPNHISFWDTVIIPAYSKRYMYMMAKEELFKKGISKWFWTSIGAFPVKRGKGDIGAIKSTLKYLKNGELVCMFPEGTRSKDGKTKKLKNGAALIASTAKVPIIPVGINADFRPFSKVTIKYGDPISFDELYGKKATKEELEEASEKLFNAIESLIEKKI